MLFPIIIAEESLTVFLPSLAKKVIQLYCMQAYRKFAGVQMIVQCGHSLIHKYIIAKIVCTADKKTVFMLFK